MDPKSAKTVEKIIIIVSIVIFVVAAVIFTLFVVKKKNSTASPSNPGNWIEEADRSVLFLSCFDESGELYCTGSGFLLYDGQTVITNYHVIDGVSSVKVYTNQNVEYNVETVRNYDAQNDIAILSLSENTNLDPLTPGDSTIVDKGDAVIAIGSPEGLQNSVSNGVLSTRTDGMLQFTAPISHGSSGGALFNNAGEVIGITSASLESGQSLNFAIPIEEVTALYANAPVGKSVQSIRDENIPFIEEMNKMREKTGPWKAVGWEQLMSDPESLYGQLVQINGYVSSNDGFCVCTASEEYITGNYEEDWEKGADLQHYPYLHLKSPLEHLEIGDKVTAIGFIIKRAFSYRFDAVWMTNGTDWGYTSYDAAKKFIDDPVIDSVETANYPKDTDICYIVENNPFFHDGHCKYYELNKATWEEYEQEQELLAGLPEITISDARSAGYLPCPYCYAAY